MINLSILKQSTIVQLCFAISYFMSGLVLIIIQGILFFGLRPFNKLLYRKINYYLSYSFYSQLVRLSQWRSKTELSLYVKKDYYDKFHGNEHGYLPMNHNYEIDWLMEWHCYRNHVLEDKMQESFMNTGDFFLESSAERAKLFKEPPRIYSLLKMLGWAVITLTPMLYLLSNRSAVQRETAAFLCRMRHCNCLSQSYTKVYWIVQNQTGLFIWN